MSLEGRLRLTIAGLVVASFAILLVGLYLLLSRSFGTIEDRQIRRDLVRARTAIADYLVTLKGKAGDWSQWDEAYAFLDSPSQAWTDANVPVNSLVQLDLNLVAFLDTAGKVVHAKSVDAATGNALPVPSPFDRPLPIDSPLLRPGEGFGGVSGLQVREGKCLLVAARPIIRSDGQGPPRGTLIFARSLDESFIARLRATAHTDLAFRPYDGDPLPRDFRSARDALESFEDIFVDTPDGERIAGFALLAGIDGRPAMILRVEQDRDVQAVGSRTLWIVLAGAATIGVILAALLQFLAVGALRSGAKASPTAARTSSVDTP